MNDINFRSALLSLYRRGFSKGDPELTPEEILAFASLQAESPPLLTPAAETRVPEAHTSTAWTAASDEDTARHELDLGSDALIGRIDTKRGVISVESKRIPASTLLYVGFPTGQVARVCGATTLATPFNRAFQAALRQTNDLERSRNLLALAAGLSPSPVRGSILLEARRSAERIEDTQTCNRLLAAIVCMEDEQEPPVAAMEEPDCSGEHWGRFVMLRPGLRQGRALAYLSCFPLDGTPTRPAKHAFTTSQYSRAIGGLASVICPSPSTATR